LKHTPGPWYAHRYTPAGIAWHVSTRGDDDDNQRDYSRVCRTTDSETAEADARLISAAPDLLAACEGLYAAFGLKDTLPLGFPPELEIVLKAAIAKAKGGAA
jgi:hypothetical protein